ncbi:hypothetical protein RFI_38216 [Reticulomyxa filosa]|uniref:Uncharacterized protein n=1 Tax=Reticulomyxa filosa TaxID=46433 RepID=X6LD06_RETFI|nr:hypothetical protein RFI_38216 [Reticulomyxa filosa]|eukprot:ETN99265.1 hypothetical protein RFI_38216 [Reticulomyxa filosa]
MIKQDIQTFLAKTIAKHAFHENTKKYDGLVIIICGHRDLQLTKYVQYLNKIFIADVCRGTNINKDMPLYGHNDNEFFIKLFSLQKYILTFFFLLYICF